MRHLLWVLILTFPALAQDSTANRTAAPAANTTQPVLQEKRLFGIIPNYRTYPLQKQYKPITTREKFKIAANDAFDRGTIALSAAFAGYGQLTNSNPSFGQGVGGYAHYFITSYADWAIGDYMTEAIFPAMLRQDPRYFRKGDGSAWSRIRHSTGSIFWTHNDSGRMMFNFSEFGGNAVGSAIALSYYPDNRSGGEFVSKLGLQVGLDMAGNVMKEFWPDLHKKMSKRKH
jgi:hypothetical protein